MTKFFLSNALEFGIEGIRVETVENRNTFKITDTVTGIEYFIRSGELGWGWCTYSTGNRSRGVKQYNVFSLNGRRRELDLADSIRVVERHIIRKRAK